MKEKPWDHEFEPPKEGFAKLQAKIANRKIQQKHFRLTILTLTFILFIILPGRVLNTSNDKLESIKETLMNSQLPTHLFTRHDAADPRSSNRRFMNKIALSMKQNRQCSTTLFQGEHYTQIAVWTEPEENLLQEAF